MANIFLMLSLVCIVLWIIFAMMIVHELSKRGVKINFFLLRLLIIKYVQQYKQITLAETGKVGPLFYPCIVSISMTFIFAIIGFLLK